MALYKNCVCRPNRHHMGSTCPKPMSWTCEPFRSLGLSALNGYWHPDSETVQESKSLSVLFQLESLFTSIFQVTLRHGLARDSANVSQMLRGITVVKGYMPSRQVTTVVLCPLGRLGYQFRFKELYSIKSLSWPPST